MKLYMSKKKELNGYMKNYFKREYFRELEEYKWHLETQKNNLKYKKK